jgi:hypothetical protein
VVGFCRPKDESSGSVTLYECHAQEVSCLNGESPNEGKSCLTNSLHSTLGLSS